jgi:hypothetical protein
MGNADNVYGSVQCSCGAVLRLPFPRGTESPAWFKNWCVECGVILEGKVHLDERRNEPAPADGETVYALIDDIEPRSLPDVRGGGDE